jgi:hypothetical protein
MGIIASKHLDMTLARSLRLLLQSDAETCLILLPYPIETNGQHIINTTT